MRERYRIRFALARQLAFAQRHPMQLPIAPRAFGHRLPARRHRPGRQKQHRYRPPATRLRYRQARQPAPRRLRHKSPTGLPPENQSPSARQTSPPLWLYVPKNSGRPCFRLWRLASFRSSHSPHQSVRFRFAIGHTHSLRCKAPRFLGKTHFP